MRGYDKNGVINNHVVSCSKTGGVIAGRPNAHSATTQPENGKRECRESRKNE